MMRVYKLNDNDAVAANNLREAVEWYAEKGGKVTDDAELSLDDTTWLEYEGPDEAYLRTRLITALQGGVDKITTNSGTYMLDVYVWRKTTYREILNDYRGKKPFVISVTEW